MKTAIVIIGLCVAIKGHAWAQTNQTVDLIETNAPTKALAAVPEEIRTYAGAVYKNFEIERVDPSGLTISYSLAGGGLGIVKITFDQLSPELRKEYGYDPQAAAQFQLGERQAAGQWAAKMFAEEQAAKLIKAEREKQEEEAARAKSAQPEEEAAKEAARKAEEEKKIKDAELAAQAAKKAAEEAAMKRATNPPPIHIIKPPVLD